MITNAVIAMHVMACIFFVMLKLLNEILADIESTFAVILLSIIARFP